MPVSKHFKSEDNAMVGMKKERETGKGRREGEETESFNYINNDQEMGREKGRQEKKGVLKLSSCQIFLCIGFHWGSL